MTPPLLVLEGVGKTFASGSRLPSTALRGVDLQVPGGEVIAFVGPSGCGKSTLLRIVAGLDPKHDGVVQLGDRVVKGPSSERGMLFQEHRLLPWLTVRDNVAFGLSGLSSAAVRRAVDEQLAIVGLSAFADAYPHELSGGMAQRAALARALAPNPSVLLLDEPFAALDAFTKIRLQEELRSTRGTLRPTVLLVTHDIEEAVFLADRIVVLSERPGMVQRIHSVTLSHPRDRTSEAFGRVRRAVLADFGSLRSPADCDSPAQAVAERAARRGSLLVPEALATES